jgi:glycosyltransferase involved in cell wall biosynthesis
MKVSVIVPVYNTEKYLQDCLDSLVNQTFKELEIIIVNDGSPDNSEKIIKKYVDRYPFIKAYKKKNGGLSSARNYGIEKAQGEYIVFIDSDDYVENNMIEQLYNSMIKNHSDIVVCEFNYVFNDTTKVRSYSNLDYTIDTVKKYLLTPPMACIRMYKKKLFTNIKFKEGIYYEDLEMNPKLVMYTNRISFVNEGLYNYVIRDDSIMHQKVFNEKLNDIYHVLKSNYDLLYANYPLEIEYMYIIHLLRTASLRFLEYQEGRVQLERIIKIINDLFPKWNKNAYFKKSSLKIKIICYLAYYKQLFLLKIIKKITGK